MAVLFFSLSGECTVWAKQRSTPALSEMHSLYFTLDSQPGVSSISCYPSESCHMKRDQYFSKMGHSKLHPNKDHTLICSIVPTMLYSFVWLGSDDPNHMSSWVDLQRPTEEAGHPQPSLVALFRFSSPPRSGSIPFGALGISAEDGNIIHKDSDTTTYATFIFPQRSKGNIKKKQWQTDGQTHITLPCH